MMVVWMVDSMAVTMVYLMVVMLDAWMVAMMAENLV